MSWNVKMNLLTAQGKSVHVWEFESDNQRQPHDFTGKLPALDCQMKLQKFKHGNTWSYISVEGMDPLPDTW